MDDQIDALHVLTITLSLSLFAATTAVAPRATMIDALPVVAAAVGVGLHRTGRLDDDGDDDQEESDADGLDADRPDGASDEQVTEAVKQTTTITDGGER